MNQIIAMFIMTAALNSVPAAEVGRMAGGSSLKPPRDTSLLLHGCGDGGGDDLMTLAEDSSAVAEGGRVVLGVLGGAAVDCPEADGLTSEVDVEDVPGSEDDAKADPSTGKELRLEMKDLNSEVSRSSLGTTIWMSSSDLRAS